MQGFQFRDRFIGLDMDKLSGELERAYQYESDTHGQVVKDGLSIHIQVRGSPDAVGMFRSIHELFACMSARLAKDPGSDPCDVTCSRLGTLWTRWPMYKISMVRMHSSHAINQRHPLISRNSPRRSRPIFHCGSHSAHHLIRTYQPEQQHLLVISFLMHDGLCTPALHCGLE